MANNKVYSITINNVQESIDAVNSLVKQLNALEAKIKEINALGVKFNNIKVSGVDDSASANALRVQKEINKQKEQGLALDAKIAAAEDESFKKLDATKALYKERLADQKAIAAQERILADNYTHTMAGMKQQLADLKAVINTTVVDEPDGLEKIKQYTQQANELNNKLLEMEKSYGQFGRQVGKYDEFGKSLQSIVVTINGVEREFGSAREATKTLNNELKAMAVQGKENTKEYEELRQKLLELESTMNDAKKPMDGILDTMESFTAIASVSKGLGAFFGVDSTEIQKSMQQLLGLQTALKGLQSIAKQVETREGIGKWIAPFTSNIDKATNKLLVYNRALLGTGKAAKTAAVGVKFFGNALKMAISGGILIAIDLLIEGVMKLVDTFKTSKKEITDVKKVMEDGADAYAHAEATLSKYQYKIDNFNGTKKQEKKLVEELNSQLGDSIGHYKSIAEWQDALIKKGPAYLQLMRLQALYQAAINQYAAQYIKLATGQAGGQELIDNTAYLKKLAEGFLKEADELSKKYKIGDYSDHIKDNNKKNKDAVKEAEKELAKERIALMKDGLTKTITQLEEERKQRLAKLDKNSKDYKKLEEQWNAVYQLKILNAREEWARKMQELNQKMWDKIASDTEANLKRITDNIQGKTEENRKKLEKSYFDNVVSKNRVFSYGVQGSNQLQPTTQFSLGLEATANQSKKMTDMKKLVDLYREMSTAFNEYQAAQQQYQRNLKVDTRKMTAEQKQMFDAEKRKMAQDVIDTKRTNDEKAKAYNDFFTELNKTYTKADILASTNKLREESYSKDLKTIFDQRYSMVERYWQSRVTLETTEAEKNYRAQIDLLNKQEERENAENLDNLRANQKQTEEYHRLMIDKIKTDGKVKILTEKQVNDRLLEEEKRYEEAKKKIQDQYEIAGEEITKKYTLENNKLIKQREDTITNTVSDAYQDRLQELRDFQTAVSTLERKQPVVNEWGITNFKETDKINQNLLSSYETMARKVIELKKAVAREIKDKDLADSILRELDNFTADLGEKMDEVKQKLSVGEKIGQFISDIQQYIQALGQGLQTIMSAVWSAQDTQFDNEARQLDKLNEKLQDAMDKNEEILEKHKNNVDSIEDELQTARGARREHLIDQLNAEVIAERRAAAEKKKIEKEQEALKKKQDDLDKKRQLAQYQRELTQILVSGALAAINAYATKPFVPVGLAMGSLSLGIVAAQYAIAKANPPKFARGGLLEGPSHAQGGIRAGGVELEGNEYVVNKHTTMQNIDLLEYINSNRRKLNISDLIDFYSGDRPRKAIQGVRTRFADGGSLPTLRTDIDVSGGLKDAFKEYAKTPSVVQVVDIVDKTKQYNNVRVLAGLAE